MRISNCISDLCSSDLYDAAMDSFTCYSTSQNPHVLRLILCAFIFGLPEHKMRVVAPDVGGGFGSKIFCYAEETDCVWASKKIRRTVKWTAERSETFLSAAHGRPEERRGVKGCVRTV